MNTTHVCVLSTHSDGYLLTFYNMLLMSVHHTIVLPSSRSLFLSPVINSASSISISKNDQFVAIGGSSFDKYSQTGKETAPSVAILNMKPDFSLTSIKLFPTMSTEMKSISFLSTQKPQDPVYLASDSKNTLIIVAQTGKGQAILAQTYISEKISKVTLLPSNRIAASTLSKSLLLFQIRYNPK